MRDVGRVESRGDTMINSRMTYLSNELEQIEFVKKASQDLTENLHHNSFGELTPGSLLAMRWGLMDNCILVLKLDVQFTPVNYEEVIKAEKKNPPISRYGGGGALV